MALIKISDLTQQTTIADAMEIPVNNAGTTEKIDVSDLKNYIKELLLTVETKTADYTFLSTDIQKLIIFNPNTVSQYGLLNGELPLGATAVQGLVYKIKHGSNAGLVKIRVNDASSNKIQYKGNALDFIYLYSPDDYINIIWDGSNWTILSMFSTIKTGELGCNQWSSRELGTINIIYTSKSPVTDWTGMTITESTSGNTWVVLEDTAPAGSTGILKCYAATGTGIATSTRTLTNVDGDTATVNANTKNVDTYITHNFGVDIYNIDVKYYMKYTDGEIYMTSSFGDEDSGGNDSGSSVSGPSINELVIYTATVYGPQFIQSAHSTSFLSTNDMHYNIILEFKV